MITCLELGANDLHMVQLMSLPPHHRFIKIQIGLTLLVLDYQGCPIHFCVCIILCLTVHCMYVYCSIVTR